MQPPAHDLTRVFQSDWLRGVGAPVEASYMMLQRHRSYASMSRIADSAMPMQIQKKHSVEISNGLRARSAGPDFIAHAHSAGPGVLDRGPLAKEPSARKRDQHGSNIASKWFQNGPNMVPTWLPNGPWRALGGLLKSLKRLGRQIWGPKKLVLNGSWPLQEEFKDRFQQSWGPRGSRKGGQDGAKWSPRGDSS